MKFVKLFLLAILYLFTSSSIASEIVQSSEKPGIDKMKLLVYSDDKGRISYGSRIYRNNCKTCHGEIGLGYVNRVESPRILGISAQDMVDGLIYYRDAESYNIQLTGKALLMSRQVLSLSNDEIYSIAKYFEDLNPLSEKNLKLLSQEEE